MAKSGSNKKMILAVVITALAVGGSFIFLVPLIEAHSFVAPQIDEPFEIPIFPDDICGEGFKPLSLICVPDDFDPNPVPPDDVEVFENGTTDADIPSDVIDELDEIDKIINMTETSNDPPLDQIIDELFEPQSIQLIANIVKIDSTLQRFNETLTFDVPLASLFVEETTDIDFRNGFIELDLKLKTDPNTQINSGGTFNIKVGDLEIFGTDAKISGSGITDQNGELSLKFTPLPLEILSDIVTFDFNAHFDKFVNEEITNISFNIKTLDVSVSEIFVCETTPCPLFPQQVLQMNGLIDQEIFSMDIFRDDIQIFITDTEGNEVRSYPMDDRFTVNSIARTQTAKASCTDPTNPSAPTLAGHSKTKCVFNAVTIGVYPAPVLTNIKLFDGNGVVISAGAGTGLVLDELIFRNANYSLTSPYGNFDLETPKSQKNYAYSCFGNKEVDYVRVTGSITNTIRPYSWDYYSPIAVGSVQTVCNFP